MSKEFRIFGAELSPYSVKVRSYFRFKEIPHKWILRGPSTNKEFTKYAKLPIVPLVISPDLEGMQDSTPIMDSMEELYKSKKANPEDKTLKFISYLLEEYSDEWGNKQMFHYRWKDPLDQISAARRIAEMNLPIYTKYIPIINSLLKNKAAKIIQNRMSERLWVIGSNKSTEVRICNSFKNLLSQLEKHLSNRKYIFGQRPSFADFGLWGQIYNSWTDPTPRKFIERDFSNLLPWIKDMHNPKIYGDYENWASLSKTLMPILKQQIGEIFLPWTDAVTKAMLKDEKEVSVMINNEEFKHSLGGPQKYHVKSLNVLRKRYKDYVDLPELESILIESNCLPYLKS